MRSVQFSDWWEHDGLHFHLRYESLGSISSILQNADSIADLATDDDHVCVGLSPTSRSWYLRVRAEQLGANLVGHFDVFAIAELQREFCQSLFDTVAHECNPKELFALLRGSAPQ